MVDLDVSWPIVTVAVTQVCTLAVVIANAYFRIAALKDQRDETRRQFHEQNRQLDRLEQTTSVVAAVAPIIAAGVATQAPSVNVTVGADKAPTDV